MTVPGVGPVQIVERSPGHPDAISMLRDFYSDQVGRYGFADSVDLDPGEFVPPDGSFVVAYRDGELVGCGGWRWYDRVNRIAEIKKIYLSPSVRGHGAGRALLSWLERDAAVAGAERAILETGVRNAAALGLFASQGYQPRASYVPGRPSEINRAFTRSLTASDRSRCPGELGPGSGQFT